MSFHHTPPETWTAFPFCPGSSYWQPLVFVYCRVPIPVSCPTRVLLLASLVDMVDTGAVSLPTRALLWLFFLHIVDPWALNLAPHKSPCWLLLLYIVDPWALCPGPHKSSCWLVLYCRPPSSVSRPTRALLYDSWYDQYRGVSCCIALLDGILKKGKFSMCSSAFTCKVSLAYAQVLSLVSYFVSKRVLESLLIHEIST